MEPMVQKAEYAPLVAVGGNQKAEYAPLVAVGGKRLSEQIMILHSAYTTALMKYKSTYIVNYFTPLDKPADYFFLIGGKVYLKKPFISLSTNGAGAFQRLKLPYRENEPHFCKLVTALGEMLRAQHLESYLKALQEYKMVCGIRGEIFLDTPEACFRLWKGILCYGAYAVEEPTRVRYIPVDFSTVSDIFLENGLRVPEQGLQKRMFVALKSGLLPIAELTPALLPREEKPISETLLRCIYLLAGEKEGHGHTLLCFFCQLALQKSPLLVAFGSIGLPLLEQVIEKALGDCARLPMQAALEPENIPVLLRSQLAGARCCISPMETPLLKEKQQQLWKRFLAGKPVEGKDGLFKKQTYTNTMTFLVTTSVHKTFLSLCNLYGPVTVELPPLTSAQRERLQALLQAWKCEGASMRAALCLLGDTLGKQGSVRSKKAVGGDMVMKRFFEACVKMGAAEEIYGDELHGAYETFFNACYGGVPMTRISFCKMLRASGEFHYYRPHHTSKDNRYAFQGLSVDKERLAEVIKAQEACTQGEEAFLERYLR